MLEYITIVNVAYKEETLRNAFLIKTQNNKHE